MENQNDKSLEQLKAAVEFAKQAIGFAFFLNGGALIALLTFVGNSIEHLPHDNVQNIAAASGYYVAGLIVATLCSVLAYSAQLNYFKKDLGIDVMSDPTNQRILMLVGLLVAIGLFGVGAVQSFQSLVISS